VTAQTPVEGVPEVPAVHGLNEGELKFAAKPGGEPNVAVRIIPTPVGAMNATGQAPTFTAGMRIDGDGAGDAWKGDRSATKQIGSPNTSLRYTDKSSLNPQKVVYAVIPPGFPAKLGDFISISYKGKTIYGVVGDIGPKGIVGECSMACAKSLGIPSSPISGGANGGVTYIALAGSGHNPLDPKLDIPKAGADAFAAANLAPKKAK
jgi:hypothetical protein